MIFMVNPKPIYHAVQVHRAWLRQYKVVWAVRFFDRDPLSFHHQCAIQPTVLPMANIAVNMLVGMPKA